MLVRSISAVPAPRNRIRVLRTALALTLDQVAERAGTSKSQIERLENGKRRLTVAWMRRLAAALQRAPAELLEVSDLGLASEEAEVLALFRQVPRDRHAMMLQILRAATATPRTSSAA
jgi:transcriptional regulator with XRE-family HTH domain